MRRLLTYIFAGYLILLPFSAFPDVKQELVEYIEAMAGNGDFEGYGHCGFRYQFYLRQHLHELTPEQQMTVAKIMERPQRSVSWTSPGGHFIFHFDTTGIHGIPPLDIRGNGVPDYVDSAAAIFEHVWDVEIEQLGFQHPLDASGNPVASYPVYFTRLPSNLYGQTWLETEISSVPGINYASFIEINTTLDLPTLYTTGLDGLRVTAAHEFNHAIQLGYRVWEDEYDKLLDLFFMEMSSTWMEEYVYDSINDYYQYLPSFFNSVLSTRFTNDYGTFPYANSIYLHMLEALYGADIVVDIWERIRKEDALKAINSILEQHSTSWPLSQNLYARWLYYTGDRAIPGQFFEEAGQFPQIYISRASRFILNDELTVDYQINPKSLGYLHLENASDIRYRAEIESPSSSGYYTHMSPVKLSENPAAFNTPKAFYPGSSDTIVIALSNPVDSTLGFTYTIREDTLLFPGIGPTMITVSGDGEAAHFYNVPADATIRVFTVNGRFVNAIKTGERKASHISWPLRDQFDHPLSSGIYLYVLEAPGVEKMGKFAVVRR